MPGNNIDRVLDPMGETIQGIVRGRRGAGRLAISALWPQIERALDAGVSVTAIWEALSQNGMVSIKLRGFTKQVKARREGAKGSGTAAKSAAEPHPSTAVAAADVGPGAGAPSAPSGSEPAVKRPGIPDRPWRQGPHVPPDPNAVFRPRDPLADD